MRDDTLRLPGGRKQHRGVPHLPWGPPVPWSCGRWRGPPVPLACAFKATQTGAHATRATRAAAPRRARLQARNVLLKSEGGAGSSVIGKVADFGLSLKMDHMETHISAVYQGTM